MIVDAHHYWRYDPVAYDWINGSMASIRRDFLPEDLQTEISSLGLNSVVSVQARQTLCEPLWLLKLVGQHAFPSAEQALIMGGNAARIYRF